MLLIINTIKEICFIPCLEEWRIYSQNLAQESCEESGVQDDTFFIDNSIGNFMIVPEKVSVKGIKVRIPELKPSLAPLNQRGRVVAYASRPSTPQVFDDASISIQQRLNSEPTKSYFNN